MEYGVYGDLIIIYPKLKAIFYLLKGDYTSFFTPKPFSTSKSMPLSTYLTHPYGSLSPNDSYIGIMEKEYYGSFREYKDYKGGI